MARTGKEVRIKQKFSMKLMWKQRYLLMMSVPFVIWLVIFKYIPLWGWSMAFQEVRPKQLAMPVWERPFVGFSQFTALFQNKQFKQVMFNTVGMAVIGIVLGFVCSIVFALLLNEVRAVKFKKITQTISYLPHFVSWVIIANIAKTFLGTSGVIDGVLQSLGLAGDKGAMLLSTDSPLLWFVINFINVWKETGWDAIIYLSAMAGIDQGLFEAAKVDGAGRFRRMWHITLPGIRPTIIVLLIMSIGGALNVGMERQMLLTNAVVENHAMVLSWWAYKIGLANNNYGLGTAVGVFQSAISLVLLFGANWMAGKFDDGKLV